MKQIIVLFYMILIVVLGFMGLRRVMCKRRLRRNGMVCLPETGHGFVKALTLGFERRVSNLEILSLKNPGLPDLDCIFPCPHILDNG